ncbi:MAG: HNH endonuclease [Rhizomicrobium sp.]
MARKRIPIPKRIEREVLFRNQSVCCVCQSSGVQIHHIDDDPSNNELANLCILCVRHHAEASSVGTIKWTLLAGPQ